MINDSCYYCHTAYVLQLFARRGNITRRRYGTHCLKYFWLLYCLHAYYYRLDRTHKHIVPTLCILHVIV